MTEKIKRRRVGRRERDKGLVVYMIFPIIFFIFEQKKTDKKKSCMPKCTGYKFVRPELAGRVESSERISRIIPV